MRRKLCRTRYAIAARIERNKRRDMDRYSKDAYQHICKVKARERRKRKKEKDKTDHHPLTQGVESG